jgi:thiamine-phosphate pyrophosphorylase
VSRRLPAPCLCLVTDRRQLAPDARTTSHEVAALERWLDDALAADVDLIQIRERDLDARELAALTRRVIANRGDRAPRIVVNDRADVALAAGADGVHVRGDGPPVETVRTLGPASWLVGRSVHTIGEVREHAAADYLFFGTVFPGGSKGASAPTQGLEALAGAVAASQTPIIAIGGMTPAGARQAVVHGAAGIAAIGAFLAPGGPVRAAAEIRAAMDQGKSQKPKVRSSDGTRDPPNF